MMKLVNPVNPTAIYSLVRYKTCGETEREVIDTICIPSEFEGGTPLPTAEGEGTDGEGTGGDAE